MAADGLARPSRLVVVAGTGTEVGKTWVSARLAQAWRREGLAVVARKPAQSFAPGTGPTDADVLARATGEDPGAVCPPHRWYEVAMAPFMAAEVLGRPPFSLGDLLDELSWPPGADIGLVEAAGGVRSPITSEGEDTVDLVEGLRPDGVLLVAEAGLGTINAVRLSLGVLPPTGAVVLLNRFDPTDDLHVRNRDWLAAHVTAPVLTDVDDLAARLRTPR